MRISDWSQTCALPICRIFGCVGSLSDPVAGPYGNGGHHSIPDMPVSGWTATTKYSALMRPWRDGAALLDSRTGTAAKGHREPDRMKILVLSSFAFSLVNFRGRLLSAMAAAGHDVIACAPDTDQEVEAEIGRAHVELQSLMRNSYAVFCLK